MNESLGNLVDFHRTPYGLEIQAENARVSLLFYAGGTLRVRIRKPDSTQNDFSYSVIAEPLAVDFGLEDTGEMLILKAPAFQLRVEKHPLRFSFCTHEGKLINGDDPAFGTSWLGQEVTTYKSLQPGERFIGMGGKTGGLDRRGKCYVNWNTDNFAYGTDDDPLYLSVPFFMGVHSGLTYGLFLDNTHKTTFNFGASTERFSWFSADDGEMDYYFLYAETVPGILQQYADLTGTMDLPPLWSLGFQQCRYSYYPDKEVLRTARTFREKNMPADVIYLDIHYMDAYKVFTWHPEYFPDPSALIKELKELGFHVVLIVDPGVKRETGYAVYESGKKEDVFVKYPDGELYAGEVWPGWSHFPDYTDPKVRAWWAHQFSTYTDHGVEGFWNDMNEPAAWGQALPNLIEFEYEGQRATHKRARNVYGFNMAKATHEGATHYLEDRRPFVLTRAGCAGIQRYSAVWTGDNVATNDHLLLGARMVAALGLSGVPFSGYDVGGFIGEPDPALFTRWMAVGAFAPFYRSHSMINSRASEPWSFGEEAEAICRNYLELRYRMLPYLYSIFEEASRTGMPVARSLAIDYPHDPNIYASPYENEYLFGPNILVVPVESTRDLARVYLPEGKWYDLFNDEVHEGAFIFEVRKDKLPVFVKASALLPFQTPQSHTEAAGDGVLELHLYQGDQPGTFAYYEDDGSSYGYRDGIYAKRTFEYLPEAKKLVISPVEGTWTSRFDRIQLFLHGFGETAQVKLGGTQLSLVSGPHSFLQPLPNFDPFPENAPDHTRVTSPSVHRVEFSWESDLMEIQIA